MKTGLAAPPAPASTKPALHARWRRVLALSLSLGTPSLAGCGADATVPYRSDGGNADGTPPTDDGGTTPTKGGQVNLSSDSAHFVAGAAFYSSLAPPNGACTTTTEGPCTVSVCSPSDGGADPIYASAGTVQVTGGHQPVQLTPNGTAYDIVTGQASLWNGGEQLDVVGAGAEAPAFHLRIVAPGYVTVTTPTWPTAGGKVPIARTQPFVVTWTGGGVGNVDVDIVELASAPSRTSVSCSFPVGSGAGTVPASALTKFPSSPTPALITIGASNTAAAVVSGWSYDVRCATHGSADAEATIQ